MVSLGSLLATLGFLLPVFAFVVLRARKDRPAWELGLDVTVAISADLLIVLALTRLVPLGTATLVSRAGYVLALLGLVGWELRPGGARRRPSWPGALGKRELLLVATAALAAVVLSMEISRQYAIWDRRWHIPLAASLRGQALPFRNVFDDTQELHYHFSGDVHAAMLQELSFGVLHASLALTLAHDIHFALIGVVLGAFMVSWGYRRFGAFALAVFALLLGGPLTLLREVDRGAHEGYSVIDFYSMSFRPHVSLAGLLFLGFTGSILARLRERDDLDWRRTAPALCACTAALSITDEASAGLLGLALGATWLVAPRVIAGTRRVGALVLVTLLAAMILPNLAYAATLSPGGQQHHFTLVPWRSPGCYSPILPLSGAKGRRMLFFDVMPSLAIALGALVHLVTRRGRGRGILAVFFLTLFALSVVMLTHVDVDNAPLESHRFMTSVFFIAPLVGLYYLGPRDVSAASPARASPYAAGLFGIGMVLAAVSTLDWVYFLTPMKANKHDHFFAMFDHYAVDCRSELGEAYGARARPTYLSKPVWYLYAGCHPVFAPGVPSLSKWVLTIGNPLFDREAFASVRRRTPPGRPVPVVCAREGAGGAADPICEAAAASGSCRDLGPHLRECELGPEQAAALAP